MRGNGYSPLFSTCRVTLLPLRWGECSYNPTMTSAFVCICDYNARNRRALAKHKQCCEVARAHIGSNLNVLLSTSMHCGGGEHDNDCDENSDDNVVYEFHDYNASNEYEDVNNDTLLCASDDSSCGEDNHSATISLCSMVDYDFNNDQNSLCNCPINIICLHSVRH